MKKSVVIFIVFIIIAGGYFFFDRQFKEVKAPENTISQPGVFEVFNPPKPTLSTTPTINPTARKNNLGGTFSSEEDTGDGSEIQVYEVTYNGSQFSPTAIEIKQDDWIFFKNSSSLDFWPASEPHPVHTVYPEFDSKKPVAPGKIFKFQFTKAGDWNYHDHLNEKVTGVVNVK